MTSRQRSGRPAKLFAAAVIVAIMPYAPPTFGHAAGMPVTATRLSTFQPSGLPPVCTSQTLTASADTWVNEQQSTTNYGTAASLSVTARNGRNARTLVRFTLPTAPAGCTLVSATLRTFTTSATTGRTLAVSRAAAAWTEGGTTWATMPGLAGTAVNTSSAAGWVQWTVTTHVEAMYSGTNEGFVVRDATEGGATTFTQIFGSREATNKPELVLQWG